MKIGTLGSEHSFHHLATEAYFGANHTICYFSSVEEICNQLNLGKIQRAVIAVSNKIAGEITGHQTLIEKHALSQIDRINFSIHLQLLALPESSMEHIKTIISHPVALNQCRLFLEQQKRIKVTAQADTASCARWIVENNALETAVIGGNYLAKAFNLLVLVDFIADENENYTVFGVFERGN